MVFTRDVIIFSFVFESDCLQYAAELAESSVDDILMYFLCRAMLR